MKLYKISFLKCYIIIYSDNVYYIEFKISKNMVMYVLICEIVFVKYMKVLKNEIKYCMLK